DVVRDQGNALMAGREGDPLYRYADDKLGEDFYQDAIIYSIKFNF
ncbi:hypothetical protein ACUOFC_01045, partial [Escherichia sp. TWPC-MK]